MHLSHLVTQLEDSMTLAITALAIKLKKEGKNVISFSAGEPDFDTPAHISEAGIQAIHDGKTRYTASAGIIELREAICAKLKRDNGLEYSPNQIVVSNGAKQSLFNAILCTINPGDEVIIPGPYWVTYPEQVKIAGGTPVIVETTAEAQFKLTPAQLEAAITPKTRCLILASPSNPTGMCYTRTELEAIAQILLKHRLFVISDEIYEYLIYDGFQHESIASLSDEMKASTIVVNGVSKAYAMTGWRIGYTASDAPLAKAMDKLQGQSTSNPSTPSQWASLAALNGPQDVVEVMRKAYQHRKDVMVSSLNAIDGVQCLNPQGAFYVFPDVSSAYGKSSKTKVITSSIDFCEAFLAEQEVACVPGSGFGSDAHIRLSYATSETAIRDGVERLKAFMASLRA